ncbi:Alpha/Beta hydrolase protein [Thelonectria olida]|uniref:Alpha/Beta hydrolase protein n=1 Tax=Thelonectria olida TaxID=1576542 RepID=A0A9P8W1W6_9HYPO|nr:Alpha/Beta hydrolase protein [Thelonectria olida]
MKTYAASWLKASVEEDLGGARPVLKGSADEMRAQFSSLASALAPCYPPPSGAIKKETGSLDTLTYSIYAPVRSDNGRALPVGIYYHPGGFVLGPGDSDDVLCRAIAEQANAIIFSVQYRLSPEHKAPAHLQDAVKGFEWAHQNATKFGGDPARMFAMGASAGAGLAFSVTHRIALGHSVADSNAVKGIVALCPYAFHPDNIPQSCQSAHSSFEDHNENTPMIDGTSVRQFFDLAGLHPDDKSYFPGLCEDYKHFPSTYIATCEFDPLRDHGKVLEQALTKEGIPVRTSHYSGLPHCFWIFPSVSEVDVFIKDTVAGVQWVIEQM